MWIYFKSKKKMIFKDIESLRVVEKVINEVTLMEENSGYKIKENSTIGVLIGGLGVLGLGEASAKLTLEKLGINGLSASGITSGLFEMGKKTNKGMLGGIFVFAILFIVPLVIFLLGVFIYRKIKLVKEKKRIYNELINKNEFLKKSLDVEVNIEIKEQMEKSNVIIEQFIEWLGQDLDIVY